MSGRRRGSSAGSAAVQSAVKWISLGAICFGIGVFVVAPLLARQAVQDTSGPPPAVVPASAPDGAAIERPVTPHRRRTAPPAAASATPAPAGLVVTPGHTPAVPGPTIDPQPDARVQQPGSVDISSHDPSRDSTPPSIATTDGAADPPKPARRRRRRHSTDTGTAPAPGTDAQPGADTPPADSGNGDGGTDGGGQSDAGAAPNDAATPDAAAATGSGTDTAPPPASPPVKRTRYRVELGTFSTQEAADQAASRAREGGFGATVKTFDRGGRTYYRVQHASYRHRSSAEAEQQRMSDAGIEATISGR